MFDLTVELTALALVAAAAGAAVVVAAGRRRGRVSLPSVLAALAVAGTVVVLGAVLPARGSLGYFGLAHVVYLAVAVTVPILGAAVMLAGRRLPASGAALAFGAVLLVPAPVGIYATHIAPFRLRVDRVVVAVEERRAGDDPITVAVLSDLQTTGVGGHERAAFRAVRDAEPDVILLPGDLFQGRFAQLETAGAELRDLLSSLDAPGGVYFVEGDVDRRDRMAALLPGTGVQVLDDRVVTIQVGDRTLVLGGTRKAWDAPAAAQVRSELVGASGDDDITVLLSHRPDTVLGLPASSGVDLTVAGHTHGGQIALPGIGPLVTLSNVPRRVGGGGLHDVDGNRIYVSPGVGMERGQAPQVRFGVPPTVAILELQG